MNGCGKSDSPIVPEKSANKGTDSVGVCGADGGKGTGQGESRKSKTGSGLRAGNACKASLSGYGR